LNTTTEKRTATVREGYQVLLRAEAEILLPEGKEVIGNYYRLLAEKCMSWATEVHGERIKNEFLSLEDLHDRALWRAQKCRLSMRIPWQSEHHIAILCESYLLGQRQDVQNSYHRLSHVWNLEEESILPIPQILELFGCGIKMRDLPFVPEGVYPEGKELIFYKNPTAQTPLAQSKSPLSKNEEKNEMQ
jgi:hypothetical protein